MGLYAQSPDNSPLNPEEKRVILLQLNELRSCRETTAIYEQYVSRDREQDAREKANFERAIELEKQATAQQKDRADFYEQAFKSLTKKPGKWCWFKRVITFGIARCN